MLVNFSHWLAKQLPFPVFFEQFYNKNCFYWFTFNSNLTPISCKNSFYGKYILCPEFEIWRVRVITYLIFWWILRAEIWCFWPLIATTTSEVKNDHAHVIRQGICNKFIDLNFCVGCMVSQPNRLFQDWTFVKYWWDGTLISRDFYEFI